MGQRTALIGMLVVVLVGLGTVAWGEQNPTRIKFGEYYASEKTVYDLVRPNFRLEYTEKLKSLQGKHVELVGYMAPTIPYDGSYFMVIKQPFDECPFCSASFDWAACTTVFMKKGHRVQYMGGPVRVMGILDIGQKKDATGLESWVRITNAVVSRYKR
jgi:hypothetical protein